MSTTTASIPSASIPAAAGQIPAGPWQGFTGGRWSDQVDVRDFIQANVTPYTGDAAFLARPDRPGAPPLDRLVAYGQARVALLIEHADIARATLDGGQPIPAGSRTPLSQLHIRVLLGQLDLGPADLDMLAIQLTAALDGPLLLYLSDTDLTVHPDRVAQRITRGWQDLIHRVARVKLGF